MKCILLLALVGFVEAQSVVPAMGAAMVDYINSNDTIPFTAKVYSRFDGKTHDELKSFLGMLTDPNIEAAKVAAASSNKTFEATAAATLPTNFTVSIKWPACASVFNTIQDQSNCGSCWAVSTASVIQDRRCIRYNAPHPAISSWDLVSCCAACQGTSGNGCDGGYPTEAFNFYINTGIVTGGMYNGGSCKPYQVAPNAPSQPTETPCSMTCQPATTRIYANDKKYGHTYQVFSNNNAAVMQEIYNRGSLVATYAVYEDFYQYSSGVYQYTTGQLVGYHAVRIVGWGETAAGVQYWRVANSWGANWGEQGFFNIIRGTNDCGFEAGLVSGTALKD